MSKPSVEHLQDKIADSFLELLQLDANAAVALVTGMFVGLMSEVTRRAGHDADRAMIINGGENRDITIHAKKG